MVVPPHRYDRKTWSFETRPDSMLRSEPFRLLRNSETLACTLLFCTKSSYAFSSMVGSVLLRVEPNHGVCRKLFLLSSHYLSVAPFDEDCALPPSTKIHRHVDSILLDRRRYQIAEPHRAIVPSHHPIRIPILVRRLHGTLDRFDRT